MAGFEPRSSGSGSDRSANCATTKKCCQTPPLEASLSSSRRQDYCFSQQANESANLTCFFALADQPDLPFA